MNDVMSFGVHRLWKKYYADLLISKYKITEKILDIASGTGDIFQLLPFKKNLYAIDPVEQMHRISQEKNDDKNIQYQVGYVEKLPYKNNFFQIISCTYGVRNYENRQQGFKEIFRCLKKNGYFLFMEFGLPKAHLIKKPYQAFLNYFCREVFLHIQLDIEYFYRHFFFERLDASVQPDLWRINFS